MGYQISCYPEVTDLCLQCGLYYRFSAEEWRSLPKPWCCVGKSGQPLKVWSTNISQYAAARPSRDNFFLPDKIIHFQPSGMQFKTASIVAFLAAVAPVLGASVSDDLGLFAQKTDVIVKEFQGLEYEKLATQGTVGHISLL